MEQSTLFHELKHLLDCFDRVCKKHNLKYTLFAGTLLGAVRHGGFIPWDDDLDVAMMREDYEKLLELPNTEFEYPFFLQTPETDPGYYKSFAKLRNSNTTEIPYKDAIFNYNHGVFIDIFPFDNIPENKKEFLKLCNKIDHAKRNLHFASRIISNVGTKGLDIKRKVFYCLFYPLVKARIVTPQRAFRKINLLASKYNTQVTPQIGTIVFSGKSRRFIYNKDDYKKSSQHLFEGDEYPIPYNYDSVLKKTYGDYMTPIEQKSEHGETLVDLDKSYLVYIQDHKEELYKLYLSR